MSANITQFNQQVSREISCSDHHLLCEQEFAEKLMANMGGGGISRRKWILLGTQVKVKCNSVDMNKHIVTKSIGSISRPQTMFKRSPCLTYLYGALDTTPPPPKERKERDVRATQATRVKDLVATKDTIMQEVCFRNNNF